MKNNIIILMTPARLTSKDYQRHDNLLGAIYKLLLNMHNYDNTPMQYTAK